MLYDLLTNPAFEYGTTVFGVFVIMAMLFDGKPSPAPWDYDGYYANSRDLDVEIELLLS
jgi:hypothetical protein